jgi:hypothetical protein
MSIPNTLTIYINTNIPGSQFIKYTPNMTLPKTNSKIVCFDPLVKLSQKIIDNTPPKDKILQFFEKNLFKTLIHRSESFQKYRTIKQATDEGIIDTNIELTLNNLFNSNTLFYINKNPYSISSRDWERGNWKIDTKITEVPTNYKGQYGISSINYRNIIQSQLKEAKEELNALPKDVIEGPSFEPQVVYPVNANNQIVPYKPNNTNTNKQIIPFVPKPNTNTNTNTNKQIIPFVPKPNTNTNNTKLLPYNKPPLIKVPKETSNDDITKPKSNNTKILRQFFKQSNYQSMVRNIYQNFNTLEQESVTKLLQNYTKSIPKTFSKNIYDDTVMNLHVIPNNGGGNCFFIAIANAINKYNSDINIDKNKKIIYFEYGESKAFTQIVIRTIVANGILENKKIYNNVMYTANLNANEMNEEFDKAYENNKNNIDENSYMDIIDDIYNNNDNFFINKPTVMNNKTLTNPFTVMSNKDEMIQYLLGNSWADERTIPIIQSKLGLTIIPIQENGQKFRIPWAYIKKNNEKPELNKWNKYMFVYLSNNHYEEITFDIYINKIKSNISIFEKNNQIIPPFYLLFMIYGNFYFPMDESERNNILILQSYLKTINNSFDKIVKNVNAKNMIFFKNFASYFPSKKSNNLLTKLSRQNSNTKIIIGGSKTNNKQTHFIYNIEGKSNISYYIIITLDLYPGTSIPTTEKPKIACKKCLDKLKKSWADLLGKRYSIQPSYYKNVSTRKNYNNNKNNKNNKTKKNKYNNNYNKNNYNKNNNNNYNNNYKNT